MDYWIAVVDDEALSLTNARNLLNANGMKVSCLRSGKDLLKFIEKNEPDLILLDVIMPEMDGFETFHALRKLEIQLGRAQTPVIFLTGENDANLERRGLKAGASDFIHKPFNQEILLRRINNTIENTKKIETLTAEATTDKLTGFLNKASGTEKISSICSDTMGALMIFDLDNFKLVNDLYGHDMGDRMLESFAQVIRLNTREKDIICRIGGDEFMGFFEGLLEEDAVSILTVRLNGQLMLEADHLMGSDHGIPLGVSIGVSFAPIHSRDYQVLFQYADSALYKVKQNGKHGFSVFDPSRDIQNDTTDLHSEIDRYSRIYDERTGSDEALELGNESFMWVYRYMVRDIKEHHGVIVKLIFMLYSKEKGKDITEASEAFCNVLKKSLEKNVAFTMPKSGIFVIAMPHMEVQDVDQIAGSVLNKWKETGSYGSVGLRYAYETVSFD